jgi:NADP-dependent 3-hydroxy acid dehydrogenase YdfG
MTAVPDGPVAVITGGLGGIGAATAVRLATLRARLVLCDRSVARAEHVRERVRAAGGTALTVKADVRDPGALRSVADAAMDAHGRIDVLVAGAGIADQSTAATGDPARWRDVVETNVLGTMYAVRAVLPPMLAQGEGHIVVIASVSGRETYVGEPAYIASKWGQVGYAHALRQEVMDHGVRVTLIEPGIVDTPLTRNNLKILPLLQATEPLTADDVAAAVGYAVGQPPHVLVGELTVRPLRQRLPDRPVG